MNKKIKLNLQNKNILSFQIKNILNFFELRREFLKFKDIPNIDVSIHTNINNNQELFIFLNSLFIIKK
jgi:hypothetical protein